MVVESTPEEHDRQIAVSLALTHFIGRALSEFGAGPLDIDTEGYNRLLHILEVVTHDTWQLFMDMHRYNPFARQQREAFIECPQTDRREDGTVKIGFQGERGAYSEMALIRHFGREVRAVGFSRLRGGLRGGHRREVDAGFVPVENSIAGTVVENYDLLLANDVCVTAEVYMDIRHTLLGIPGAVLGKYQRADSHPHALNQCKAFLKAHGIRPQPTYDTAGAARILSQNPRPEQGPSPPSCVPRYTG